MGVVSKKVGMVYDFSRTLRVHHYTRTPLLEILDPPLLYHVQRAGLAGPQDYKYKHPTSNFTVCMQ